MAKKYIKGVSAAAPSGPTRTGPRATVTYDEVVRKRREGAKHLKGLGTGLLGLKRSGTASTGAGLRSTMKEQATELLAACGIDAVLESLDKTYHKKDFSLMTVQTNKEKMRRIIDPTYKALTGDLESLKIKQISLTDALRVLDEPRPDGLRIQTEQIKKDQTSDFKMLAAKMVRSSRDDTTKKTLKYFKSYSTDSPARLAKLPFASKVRPTGAPDKSPRVGE